ncbi:MAG: pyridoxamine 5'-phosphate oxidase family protein [Candidatus Promineifilaceae bacterium]|jgi:hypothetical protein
MNNNVSVEDFLRESKIPLRLSCVMESGWPTVLSLWYLFEEGSLFCATPEKARVVSFLRAEPRCSFEVASDQPPYCGVRGKAIAVIDGGRGAAILEKLLLRYLGGADNALAKQLLGRSGPEVAIRLEPQTFYTWDFTSRMADSLTSQEAKICPG